MTKIALASLLALGFATSAFASDASMLNKERNAYYRQTQAITPAAKTFAYAPAQTKVLGFTAAEKREFNRVPFSEISSH